MTNLLDRAHALASVRISAMLDQALKTLSLSVLDEYVVYALDSLDDLNDAARTIGAQAKTFRTKSTEFQDRAQGLDQEIDNLVLRGNDARAMSAQRKLNALVEMSLEYGTHYQRLDEKYQQILDARLTLEAKLTEVRHEREQLQALLESTAAEQAVAEALLAGKETSHSRDADIARVAGSIRSRVDSDRPRTLPTASPVDERIDHLLGFQRVGKQISQRKRRLGVVP